MAPPPGWAGPGRAELCRVACSGCCSTAACRWRIDDGCQCSMLSEAELALLLQLVAAHPEAACGVRHMGVSAAELGQAFDACE